MLETLEFGFVGSVLCSLPSMFLLVKLCRSRNNIRKIGIEAAMMVTADSAVLLMGILMSVVRCYHDSKVQAKDAYQWMRGAATSVFGRLVCRLRKI